MIPVFFEGSEEIKKPKSMTDEECSSVWAFTGTDIIGRDFYLTAWKPNYEDIQAINRGEPIYVKTISKRLPPMQLFTIDTNNEANVG